MMLELNPGEIPEPATPRIQQKFLVVGLGNPGRKYRANRHNLGFMVVDALAEMHDISLAKVRNKAILGTGHIVRCSVVLAKPQTFMNLSGDSVGPLSKYFRVPLENMLVIYDELDLSLGTIRLRQKGGAGGHNGMKSIIQHLGQEFPRLRLGVGRPPGQMPSAAYLLQDFKKEEIPIVEEVIEQAKEAVVTFILDGIDLAMSRHNRNLNDDE